MAKIDRARYAADLLLQGHTWTASRLRLPSTPSVPPTTFKDAGNPDVQGFLVHSDSPRIASTLPGPVGEEEKRLRTTVAVNPIRDGEQTTFFEVLLPEQAPKRGIVFQNNVGQRFADRTHRARWEEALREPDTLIVARTDSVRITAHPTDVVTPQIEGTPETFAEAVTVFLHEKHPELTNDQIEWTDWTKRKKVGELNGLLVFGGETIQTPWTGDKELYLSSIGDPSAGGASSHMLVITDKPVLEIDNPTFVTVESLCACMTHGRMGHDCNESLPPRMLNILGRDDTGDKIFAIDPYGTSNGTGNVTSDAEALVRRVLEEEGIIMSNLEVHHKFFGELANLREFSLLTRLLAALPRQDNTVHVDSKNKAKIAAVKAAGFIVKEIPSGVSDERLAEIYGNANLKNPPDRYATN